MSMKVTREEFIGVTYDELLAENARLWEELEAAKHDLQVFSMGSVQLEADNAKLRELCAGLLTGYECGYGELCKGCMWNGVSDSKTFLCLPRAIARDLGVEVTS